MSSVPPPSDSSCPTCLMCEAPAAVRFTLCNEQETPAQAFASWTGYRCAAHWLITPAFLAGIAEPVGHAVTSRRWHLVVDTAFSRDVRGPGCRCGRPAGHRAPAAPESGRPCDPSPPPPPLSDRAVQLLTERTPA